MRSDRSTQSRFRLSVGAVSFDVMHAAFAYSAARSKPLALMASRHQVGLQHGYVTTIGDFSQHCVQLGRKFPRADIQLARDHLAPSGLDDAAIQSLDHEVRVLLDHNVTYIHLDFGAFHEDFEIALPKLSATIEKSRRLCPTVRIEASTTPDDDWHYIDTAHEHLPMVAALEPEFVVLPTGSLVLDGQQSGEFAANRVARSALLAHSLQCGVKEHNSDFLSDGDVTLRDGVVDAFNIAPECGIRQTLATVELCRTQGVDERTFLEEAYASGHWRKWARNAYTPRARAILAGHYVFNGTAYRGIAEALRKVVDFDQIIEATHFSIFDRYLKRV